MKTQDKIAKKIKLEYFSNGTDGKMFKSVNALMMPKITANVKYF